MSETKSQKPRNKKMDTPTTNHLPTEPAACAGPNCAELHGSVIERRYTVEEIKRYAESFLLPAMCGDDAQDGGPIENRQLRIMLGNIDYVTGQGTIGDFLSQNNEVSESAESGDRRQNNRSNHMKTETGIEADSLQRLVQPARPSVEHELKTWPSFFDEVESERKTFEIRRNDRDYRVGDMLRLREWVPLGEKRGYTGREVSREVTYITDFDQQPGNVVMGIRPLLNGSDEPRGGQS